MYTLVSPHFVAQPVTEEDMIIASLAWGFTLGFGWLTTWTALKQTTQIWRRYGRRSLRNAYVWMIWLEILVCAIFSIICWLHLNGNIPPSFAFYFTILTTWALQVQFLLQIIINRCAILLPDPRIAKRLKIVVAILITAINISVYNIWIPARLQISEKYIWTNEWWDRIEKVLYLLVDGSLNIYFIVIVKRNLVSNGLAKYRRLTKFNIFIIGFSLSMDVLIISMMSLDNTFVYMQFHPLAYMVKLKIEMSMADLIAKVSKMQDRPQTFYPSYARSGSGSGSGNRSTTGRNHNCQMQAVPRSRNAVPFRIWQGGDSVHWTPANVVGLDGTGGSVPCAREFAPCRSAWSTTPESSQSDPQENSMELYMVREVTVQTEALPRSSDSRGESRCSLSDDNGTRDSQGPMRTDDHALLRENQSQLIWDGGQTVSTTVHVGTKLDV